MSGSGRGSGKKIFPESEKALLAMKYFLYAFNVVSVLLGMVIFALGLWIRYQWSFKAYVYGLQMFQLWTGAYILMVAAFFAIFMGVIGCWGTVTENPFLLLVYGSVLILCFITEMSGIIYILLNGTLWTNITWWLRDKFYTLIYTSDYDEKGARILRIMQENIGCCGSYSSLDYIHVNKPVPNECRDKATGNEYLDGCYIRISRYLEQRSGWIAGVSLLLAVLQIAGIMATFIMRHTLKKLESEGKNYDLVQKKTAA